MVLGLLLGLLPFRCDLCCSTFSADDVKPAVGDNRTGSEVKDRRGASRTGNETIGCDLGRLSNTSWRVARMLSSDAL